VTHKYWARQVNHIKHAMWCTSIGPFVEQVNYIKHAMWHTNIGPFVRNDLPHGTLILVNMLINLVTTYRPFGSHVN